MFRALFAFLLMSFTSNAIVHADEPKSPELTVEEKKLADRANELNEQAGQLYQAGKPAEAVEKLRESLAIFQKLYPATKYPDGHADLASGLNNLGFVLKLMGQLENALGYYQQSLAMIRKLYPAKKHPDGHADLAQSLNNMGSLLQAMGQLENGLEFLDEALRMRRTLFPLSKFPDGHPDLAQSINNMGNILKAMGQAEQAANYLQQSLDMNRKLFPISKFPDGHPDISNSLNSLGVLHWEIGQAEKAHDFCRQGLEMNCNLYPIGKYPNGHPDIANSLNSVGVALEAMGQTERALTFFQQCLEMYRKLLPDAQYPDGHPVLATTMNNLGAAHQSLRQMVQAHDYFRQSLEMQKKLYPESSHPNGHASIALSLHNVAGALSNRGQFKEALRYFQSSLEMKRKLYPKTKYPNGHPEIALTLNNLGGTWNELSQTEKALASYQEAREMYGRLFDSNRYPDGHPLLAISINNSAGMLELTGRSKDAMACYQQSLEMQQRLLRRELATASEEAAFDKIAAQAAFRDAYLSITRNDPTLAAASFTFIWPSRSIVTRLLEQRQANARAAGTELGQKLDRLRGIRRRTEQLLQQDQADKSERDKLLVKYADERDRLERELIAAMPAMKRWQELDKLGPAELIEQLPAGAAFVDVIRYTRYEYVNRKEKKTPSYVVFVVSPASRTGPQGVDRTAESTIKRVELGDAAPIDAAITTWRTSIDQLKDRRGVGAGNVAPTEKPTDNVAEILRKLVWDPIAKQIPAGSRTIYIAPDGDLSRMPWAALPTSTGRILLEDFEVAVAPHGAFLLDQLKWPRQADGEKLFALGDVAYGEKWQALPGTKSEMENILSLSPAEREKASLGEVSVERVSRSLAQVGYAHIATHGFFDAEGFANEKKREDLALKTKQFGDDSRRVASKNPLGFVGLVLSNGKVMTGLSIVDLRLEKLKLVTLSACETGLGELTGGEGVQGLQRAFHLAGCPNVVASLWKVSDAATAALMAKFYHELWGNKKSPLAALREAQLFIYYNPDKIPDVLGDRGAPKRTEALAVKTTGTSPVARTERADTKLWAAFVLSGVGK